VIARSDKKERNDNANEIGGRCKTWKVTHDGCHRTVVQCFRRRSCKIVGVDVCAVVVLCARSSLFAFELIVSKLHCLHLIYIYIYYGTCTTIDGFSRRVLIDILLLLLQCSYRDYNSNKSVLNTFSIRSEEGKRLPGIVFHLRRSARVKYFRGYWGSDRVKMSLTVWCLINNCWPRIVL
jgi:hypothetical protein